MQQRGFEEIHSAEGSWWYDGRISLIQRLLRRFGAHDEVICDVGAGYGAMCPALKPFGRTTAYEPNLDVRDIREICAKNCDEVSDAADLSDLVQKRKEAFSLVTLLDVVEHVEDDLGFLKQPNRIVKPGGHMLVTVPAFMFL